MRRCPKDTKFAEAAQLIYDSTLRMEAALECLMNSFAGLRSGKATPALLDSIRVEYHGQPTPLNQLALVSAPEPRLLVIKTYDPNAVPAIEKAILKSQMGLTPQRSGGMLRVPVPSLSEERCEQLVKQASDVAEGQRVAVRNIRRDAMKSAESMELGEDLLNRLKTQIEGLTKSYIKDVDELLGAKTEALLGTADHWFPTSDARRRGR